MSVSVPGPDGLLRCPWAVSSPDYRFYHDDEWGRPVHGDVGLFERLSLEAFQSGLSWFTILRKRPAFRLAFAGFLPAAVARFDEDDVRRLMSDSAIVRNRAKIEATISNARQVMQLTRTLDELLWSFAPASPAAPPATLREVPTSTPESTAMAKLLKAKGFRFVGPTTTYALMQATGMVNDHLVDCAVRSRVAGGRS